MTDAMAEFRGICTYIKFDQPLPTQLAVYGRRIVLANGNPQAIAQNSNLTPWNIQPHYAQLTVPANAAIAGPAADLFYPNMDGDQATLVLNLNTVGMDPSQSGAPPMTGLTGATLHWVDAFGEPLETDTANCMPNLTASLPDDEKPAKAGPAVTSKDNRYVSAYFDFVTGRLDGRQVIANGAATGQAFIDLHVTTIGPPQLLITPWDGSAPTLVTLPEDDAYAVVSNKPVTAGQDSDNDFVLHFVVTDNQFPVFPTLNILTSCPPKPPLQQGSEAGPGCSSSGIP